MDVEIFPYDPTNEMELLNHADFAKNKVLNDLVTANRVSVFLTCLWNGRIITENAVQKSDLARYFRYTAKGALRVKKFLPNNLYWERVEMRLNGKGECQEKNNTDVRTSFKIDDHKFLVPGLFTFGQRTVPEGYVHVIETTTAPMCVYRLKDEAIKEHRVILKESSFNPKDEKKWYRRFILQPNTRYQFESKTTYLIVTAQKTMFSLHVFTNPRDDVYGYNPFQHEKYLKDPYSRVPQTPRPVSSLPIQKSAEPDKPPSPENFFLKPPPPKKVFKRPPSPENIFLTPTLSKKRSLDDVIEETLGSPLSKKRCIEEETLESPFSKERLVEEEVIEKTSEPRIIKWAKGPYDYPHPDVSTEWYRVDERIKKMKPYLLSAQTEAIDYSRINPPQCNRKSFECDYLDESMNSYFSDEEENEQLPSIDCDRLPESVNPCFSDEPKNEQLPLIDFDYLNESVNPCFSDEPKNEQLPLIDFNHSNESVNPCLLDELGNAEWPSIDFLDTFENITPTIVTDDDIDNLFKDL